MRIFEEQYFLKYPTNGGEPYFVFDGKKKTKSLILKFLMDDGYPEAFSELLIETGHAFGALHDMYAFRYHVDGRLYKERKKNWHLGRVDQDPYEIGSNGMIGYWEAVECLYENGLTWETAREEVAKGRYEEIMNEKGRNIDEGPYDLSGWDSLEDQEVSETLYWQTLHKDNKFPHTREQTIGVIKILISFGYPSVIAQRFVAEGVAKHLVARGDSIYGSIKNALRYNKSDEWYGLDKPLAAPYLVSPEGEKFTYYNFICHFMDSGDSLKEAMCLAENFS